jgi:hypothetical protein
MVKINGIDPFKMLCLLGRSFGELHDGYFETNVLFQLPHLHDQNQSN